MAEVLAVGVYLADRPNAAGGLSYELATSRRHRVEQRWIALAPDGVGQPDLPATHSVVTERTSKFVLLDRIVGDAGRFDWLLLCDDDVEASPGFLDDFIALAEECDFALAQPARTADSYIDHPIVGILPGVRARRTRFVEIGPVVAVRRDAMHLILPFGEIGMGWGLDLVWPARIEAAGLRMGIVDATPVAHRMRPPVAGYKHSDAQAEMDALLAAEAHLDPDEAFRVLEIVT
jgi:hypothetical protein